MKELGVSGQWLRENPLRIAYGEALAELGAENDKIVVLDADLSNATMTNSFSSGVSRPLL